MTVVDPQLRVHGSEGLQIFDASVIPNVLSGKTNAPTILNAVKAGDMILGAPLTSPVRQSASAAAHV